MKVRTRAIKARTFNGLLRYVWFEDKAAGRPHVFTVLVLNVGDPVVIGRELPEYHIRLLIEDYEREVEKLQKKGKWFYGERNFVLTVRNTVSDLRSKTAESAR